MDGRATEIRIPPAPRPDSVSVLDVPVFRHRLMVMTALAKRLPVSFIPEQFRVTAMRRDMVNDRCRNQTSLLFAADTPRMPFQKELPGFLPFPSVATRLCTGPFALAQPFVFFTVFSSVWHQLRAARILAWRLWSSRHLILPFPVGNWYTK